MKKILFLLIVIFASSCATTKFKITHVETNQFREYKLTNFEIKQDTIFAVRKDGKPFRVPLQAFPYYKYEIN